MPQMILILYLLIWNIFAFNMVSHEAFRYFLKYFTNHSEFSIKSDGARCQVLDMIAINRKPQFKDLKHNLSNVKHFRDFSKCISIDKKTCQ